MITTNYFNVARIVGIGAQLTGAEDFLLIHDGDYIVRIDVDEEFTVKVQVFDNSFRVVPGSRHAPKRITVTMTPGRWNIIAGFLFDVDTVWKLNG